MTRWWSALALGLLAVPARARAQEPPAESPPDPENTAPIDVDVAAPPPPAVAKSGVSGHKAAQTPGAEGDPTQVVPSFPGVARPPIGSSDIVVWGADGGETLVLVEGIPVPALYHFGGVRGVIPAEAVGSIELVPGAFGPERGNALGGLVEVGLERGEREGVHGTLAADTLDASGTLWMTRGGARALASGRYGYLNRLVSAVAPDVASLYVVPEYFDGVAAMETDVGSGTVGSLVLFSSDDAERTAPSADPSEVESDRTTRTFMRAGVPASWLHGDGSRSEALAYWGRDDERRERRFGELPLVLEDKAWLWGVRAEHAFVVAGPVSARFGGDVEGRHASLSRNGSLTLPPREGDPAVFGEEPAGDVTADAWHIDRVNLAPYGALDVVLGPVHASLGGRADFTVTAGDRGTVRVGDLPPIGFAQIEPTFDPRASVTVDLGERFDVFAAAGGYHQPAAPEDLSAVFGNPGLEKARAIVASLGSRAVLAEPLRLEVTGFYRLLDELWARSRLAAPDKGKVLTQNGEGRSYGAQALLRLREFHGFSGWIAYTISRSERKIDVEPTFRLFDRDQPHVLSAVLGYDIGAWNFGARFRYTSGVPRTPVLGSYYVTQGDRFEPIFGATNSARLDDFYQLDLHAEVAIDVAPLELSLYLDVQNVTAHENAEDLAFDFDYAESAPITGLPTLGVLGARLSF